MASSSVMATATGAIDIWTVNDMRLGDLDVLKEMLIKERDAIPLTRTERYGFGVEFPNPHGESMRGGIKKALRCMEQTPTIDAVPVVRCRECKYNNSPDCPMVYEEYFVDEDYGGDTYVIDKAVDPEGFCSYGERKGG